MKKIILYLFISLPFNLYAQIPNGDYESWTLGGTGDNPDFCMTSNVIYKTIDLIMVSSHPISAIKTSPGYSGNYALTLQNVTGTKNGMPMDTVPGLLSIVTSTGKEGFSIAERYNSLIGYYKFQQGNSTGIKIDTASINISFSKWNEITKSRDIIGKGQLSIYNNMSTYTFFNIAITYQNLLMPDSAQISILSSLARVKFPGTSLTIDNLALDGTASTIATGIKNNYLSEIISAYPNPALDEINIKNIPEEASMIELRDLTGKKIQSTEITSNLMTIKTNAFSSGTYIYSIINKTGEAIYINKISIDH